MKSAVAWFDPEYTVGLGCWRFVLIEVKVSFKSLSFELKLSQLRALASVIVGETILTPPFLFVLSISFGLMIEMFCEIWDTEGLETSNLH